MRKYYFDIIIVVFLILSAFLYSFTLEEKKCFFMGDSISMMYGKYLPQELNSNFIYGRKGDDLSPFGAASFKSEANGEDSHTAKKYLDSLFSSTNFNTDVFVLNCGLHDIKVNPQTGKPLVSEKEYRQNIDYLLTTILNRQILPVFVTTTPVNDSLHNLSGVHFYRYNADVIAYNKIVEDVCRKKQVQIIDLYSYTIRLGESQDLYVDHVHFNDDVRRKHAKYIADFLNNL